MVTIAQASVYCYACEPCRHGLAEGARGSAPRRCPRASGQSSDAAASTSSSCAACFLPERRGPLPDMGWVRICACARGWNAPAKSERLREEETQFPLKRKTLRRRRRPPSRLGRIRRIVDRSDHACLRRRHASSKASRRGRDPSGSDSSSASSADPSRSPRSS